MLHQMTHKMSCWVTLFNSVHELKMIKMSFKTLLKKLREIESKSLEESNKITKDSNDLVSK